MTIDDERIEKALARILENRRAGASVSVEAIVAENPDLEEPLRARLRVFRMLDALREPRDAESRTPSVLDCLSRTGRSVRSVSLPDPEGEESPPVVLPQAPSGQWGRYSVQGEIARGGMGVVFKAATRTSGRDVAMKVLREEHASRPDVLQRFVEEAQIGGQLQHPGIVPVYELGRRADGRPFFAMKLVKGRTLADVLAERKHAGGGRPRLLSRSSSRSARRSPTRTRGGVDPPRPEARERHGRRVRRGAGRGLGHREGAGAAAASPTSARDAQERAAAPTVRDGALGERGARRRWTGSVMGTPPYMPPEQAAGEVDRLDERADVFALGAILCEILTGKPPYAGTEREVLRRRPRRRALAIRPRAARARAAPIPRSSHLRFDASRPRRKIDRATRGCWLGRSPRISRHSKVGPARPNCPRSRLGLLRRRNVAPGD